MKKARSGASKIAIMGIFTALSLIMFLIENLFPPLLIPGAKMGLANIFSLAALIIYGPVEAFLIIIARTLLGAMFAGNPYSLLFSFTGGIVAMTVSTILLYVLYPKISFMAVSIVAAIAHNLTQNLVFVFTQDTPLLLSYMPYLALIGILSGAIVGAAVVIIVKKVPPKIFGYSLNERKSNGVTPITTNADTEDKQG